MGRHNFCLGGLPFFRPPRPVLDMDGVSWEVTIRSLDRIGTAGATSFTVALPEVPAFAREFDRIALTGLSVPVVWYTVSQSHNKLLFTNDTSVTTTEVSIPVGNYPARNLAAVLSALLTPLAETALTVVINQVTGKFEVTDGPGGHTYALLASDRRLARILGLDDGEEFYFGGGSTTVSFPNCAYLQLTPALSVRMTHLVGTQTLADVYSSNPGYSVLQYVPGFDPINRSRILAAPLGLQPTLTVSLVDLEYDEPMDLNGQDWVMTVKFFKTSQAAEDSAAMLRALVGYKRAKAEAELEQIQQEAEEDDQPVAKRAKLEDDEDDEADQEDEDNEEDASDVPATPPPSPEEETEDAGAESAPAEQAAADGEAEEESKEATETPATPAEALQKEQDAKKAVVNAAMTGEEASKALGAQKSAAASTLSPALTQNPEAAAVDPEPQPEPPRPNASKFGLLP